MGKRLGINVDHVATLRQARGTPYPDPLAAALLTEKAGADQVTVHLREDRRHIQDRDLILLRRAVTTELNLEMAATEEMFRIASEARPDTATLVPERRQELTTEGGLDLSKRTLKIEKGIGKLREVGVRSSAFIDPDQKQIALAKKMGFDTVELHTGSYCEAKGEEGEEEFRRLQEAAIVAAELGLYVAAGHGIHYQNARVIASIPQIQEFNIGHSIVARAIYVGLAEAVREMKKLLQ